MSVSSGTYKSHGIVQSRQEDYSDKIQPDGAANAPGERDGKLPPDTLTVPAEQLEAHPLLRVVSGVADLGRMRKGWNVCLSRLVRTETLYDISILIRAWGTRTLTTPNPSILQEQRSIAGYVH